MYMAWLVILAVIGAAGMLSAQELAEEKVVVTANAYPVPFENLARAVSVLTSADIGNVPVRSLLDAVAHTVAMDIRPRSPLGMQADISMRGSSFSQVLVLVDGVRINDSQTGHHNADFPVQMQDVERVEILRGPGSSLYGADALGGIVNIITRRGVEPARFSITWGQNGLVEGSFGAGVRKGDWEQSLSVTAGRAAGFMFDRDFRHISLSSRTRMGSDSTLFISHVNKEFGAHGFYGPSPSREWTNQTFVSFEHRSGNTSGPEHTYLAYYRTHGDRFLYDIRAPGFFENTHRTHAAGAMAKARRILDHAFALALGAEVGGDWIRSSNLGDHAYVRTSLYGEGQWTPRSTVVLYPGLRVDCYSRFGVALSPSVSGSWWIKPRLRLRSSAGRAFRIPSFTELYYRDPNHQAESALKPESAWAAEIGADLVPARGWIASLAVFRRHERNVIDWVRNSPGEKWRTANLRRIKTSGLELGAEREIKQHGRISINYSFISIDAGRVDYSSKYVLDYARHCGSVAASFSLPLALRYQQRLIYKMRSGGRSYWLVDGRLERDFGRFTAAIDGTNLLNTHYQEVVGVDMPGRWLALSVRARL